MVCVVYQRLCGIPAFVWYTSVCVVYQRLCGIPAFVWYTSVCVVYQRLCGIPAGNHEIGVMGKNCQNGCQLPCQEGSRELAWGQPPQVLESPSPMATPLTSLSAVSNNRRIGNSFIRPRPRNRMDHHVGAPHRDCLASAGRSGV